MSEFIERHIGPRPAERDEMLAALGCASTDALIDETVPGDIRDREPLALPAAMSEDEALAALARIAGQNDVRKSFIGMGYYGTRMPAVIRRNVLESPAWYTAYTPYQAEISQGRLEALLNFQQMVCDLTGLAIANASLLDEASAAAEAMALCERDKQRPSRAFFVAEDCHPQTIAVLRTRAEVLGWPLIVDAPERAVGADVFGALFQYPGTAGAIVDYRSLIATLRAAGVRVAMATDLLALTLLVPPAELGAEIAIGSSQRFGVPLGYGGPHAAFMACTDELKRGMPGRLVGVSVDAHGAPALRLALQAREQHIRREKATSNICTSEVLLAVLASMYAVYHGPAGLRAIAERVHAHARTLAAGLRDLGWAMSATAFFDTLGVASGPRTDAVLARAEAQRVNLRRIDAQSIGIALDETTTAADIDLLLDIFRTDAPLGVAAGEAPLGIPAALRRQSAYLTHPVFHTHRSETAMLRYLRMLADRDLALDRTMIPLGSCTMKLNGTTGMLAIGWPGFADLHPFAPPEQARGYRELIDDLERMLCAITGYDAVSLQPNSGAQGEFAGLLAIRAWHASRGESQRDIVLIPTSAHGTNPASAHMAGYDVVTVACDARGNIDLGDLRAKLAAHRARLAALMVTYPSTHGVFEPAIAEVCRLIHDAGGQVYLDGANLNGLMGIAAPGRFGADASHLNLHKTFAIPHGGGGPGVGPLAVRAHLAPFLPGHPLAPELAARRGGSVAAAPHGSAGILPIAWAYIRLMGAQGLRACAHSAILAANYVAARLRPHYPILYTGANDRVAHECIIDIRPFKAASGVTAEDVAKRLIDYGIHAPTLSFPVAGTLMIEPTESEPKAELDRFCEAMIAIRGEIAAIAAGRWPHDDNPLRNAPHAARALATDAWTHPYSRKEACFPVPVLERVKYWSPVGRIDNAYGDRHLFCTCPSVA